MAVTYLDGTGGGLGASVLAVTSTGGTGYKTLSLRLFADGRELHDVPHEGDAAPGAGCWTLGPLPAAPVVAAPEVEAPSRWRDQLGPIRRLDSRKGR